MSRVYERDATVSIARTGAKVYFKPVACDERRPLLVPNCCDRVTVERPEHEVRLCALHRPSLRCSTSD
jgi:hypothetical protein